MAGPISKIQSSCKMKDGTPEHISPNFSNNMVDMQASDPREACLWFQKQKKGDWILWWLYFGG